ncbi:hypothetical protein PHYPSEUDO_008304 [Phytophthora pseudosyringae]|uniref:Uncharacterized protein n=1 Tax=Phytophthora pseudosyringae TaxID=221518 RepID=A0A8T1VHM4_9STRA|nr:hypothetical protein PHYPSEUDO_008304 [Phytophthora pseudosyringae]
MRKMNAAVDKQRLLLEMQADRGCHRREQYGCSKWRWACWCLADLYWVGEGRVRPTHAARVVLDADESLCVLDNHRHGYLTSIVATALHLNVELLQNVNEG